MTAGGYVDDIRVRRVHHDAADMVAVGETKVGPRLAGVHTLVDAVTPRRALTVVGLAHPNVKDRRVGRRDRNVADGRYRKLIGKRSEGDATVGGLKDTSGGSPNVHDARVGFHDREVVEAPAGVCWPD